MKQKYEFKSIVAETLLIPLYMKFFRSRWGFFFGQILGRIPWLCYKFSSLLGYKIISK